jgi:uncharacterized protein
MGWTSRSRPILGAKTAVVGLIVAMGCSAVKTSGADMDATQVFANPRMVEAARAVEREDVSALNALARSGLNVNEPGKQGVTLLFWAMKYQKKGSMRALLNLKADPNQKLDNHDSPVTLAAAAPDGEILRILLEGGADPNLRNRNDTPAIDEALDRSLWKNFDLLVARGADPGATDKSGATPLIRLAQVNRFADVERLLDRRIDINKADHKGRTLLWYVENSAVGPATTQGKARDRVRTILKQRGAR